jgi:hypothetical protein
VTHQAQLLDLLVQGVEFHVGGVERAACRAPGGVEHEDLVDERDIGEAPALRLADDLRVAALLDAEEVDVQHLGRAFGNGSASARRPPRRRGAGSRPAPPAPELQTCARLALDALGDAAGQRFCTSWNTCARARMA